MKSKYTINSTQQPAGAQRGAVLITSLVILLVLTVLGVSAMNTSSLEEMMAGNLRDQTLSFNAAETGLAGAADTINNWGGRPVATPGGTNNGVFTKDVFGDYATRAFDAGVWSQGIEYGAPSTTDIPGVIEDPVYIIEEADFVAQSAAIGDAVGGKGKVYYKVTSRGRGQSANSITLLQVTYAKRN